MQKSRVFALITFVLLSSSASAVPISFIYTGVASGSIGDTAFTDAAFTITANADTDDRQNRIFGTGFFVNHTSVMINIGGLESANFVTSTRTFVNNDIAVVGFSRGGPSGWDLYDSDRNATYSTWDMLSSLSPIQGLFDLVQWNDAPVETDHGTLSFIDSLGGPGSFQAVTPVTSVPEPGSLALFSLGALALAFKFRRRPTQN